MRRGEGEGEGEGEDEGEGDVGEVEGEVYSRKVKFY